MALDDRPRGILSQSDRQYLRNPEEYSSQASYERRQAIIERIHNALHDYPLLVSALDDEYRKEAFEDRFEEPLEETMPEKEHTINVLHSAFAFLYLGITDTVEPEELGKDAFEDLVGSGVKTALLQRGDTVRNVSVDIEVETGPSLAEVRDKETPALPEIFQLLEAGEISGKEAFNLFRELPGDEPVDPEGKFSGAATEAYIHELAPLFEEAADTDEQQSGGE